MQVAVAGATGLIGSHLTRTLLAAGHHVTALSRDPATHTFPAGVAALAWDGASPPPLDGAAPDALVLCTGQGIVDKPWGPARRRALSDSRVGVTMQAAQWIARLPEGQRPALVAMSAVGYYGAWPPAPVDEASPAGTDFAAALCAEWEAAALQAPTRVALARMGLVLDPDGGYLGPLLPLFRRGLGGPIGTGTQPVAWAHRDDAAAALRWMVETPGAAGPYNVVAPASDTFADLARNLGQVLHRPARLRVPAFAVRLRFGSRAPVVLGGQAVLPRRLQEAGFTFQHANLHEALRDVLREGLRDGLRDGRRDELRAT